MAKDSEILIKGYTLDKWEEWINKELPHPNTETDQIKYVLEAFLELIETTKKMR